MTNTNIRCDFNNIIVHKPWGYEYLIYNNKDIAIWRLHISKGASTSLHSHPNKKTGLIILSGGAELNFLNNNAKKMFPLETVMLRQGVFHKTKAITSDVQLLEVENPNNKADLIRLKDNYGREGTPYETREHQTTDITLQKLVFGENYIDGNLLTMFNIQTLEDVNNTPYDIFMILEGFISFKEFSVIGPGDVINRYNFLNMIEQFTLNPMLVVGICTTN